MNRWRRSEARAEARESLAADAQPAGRPDGGFLPAPRPPRSRRPPQRGDIHIHGGGGHRFSLEIEEKIARLADCGVVGDDDALVALLEAARFDVDRAANFWLDRATGTLAADDVADGVEADRRALRPTSVEAAWQEGAALEVRAGQASGHAAAPRRQRPPRAERPARAEGGAPARGSEGAPGAPATGYAKLSQKGGHRGRHAVHFSLIGTEGEELPTGLRYEAAAGESYDVDVKRMVQVHNESGSERKIRREKPGLWRFDKRGSIWGVYPAEVSKELDRVFLALGRRSSSWDRQAEARPAAAPGPRPATARSTVDPVGFSEDSLEALERSLAASSLQPEALLAVRDQLLVAAEAGGLVGAVRAAALLAAFAARHGLTCDAGCARRAGLVVGSMRLLQAVLASSPGLSLVGAEVFDKKYPKLSLQDLGRKNCVRCLLSRGMVPGSPNCVPQGKLLRKVEADATPAWARRCLISMVSARPDMPEAVMDRVCLFLGLEG